MFFCGWVGQTELSFLADSLHQCTMDSVMLKTNKKPKKETFGFGLRYVGYSQDSMTAAEFDITDVLKQSKPAENGGFGRAIFC